MGVADDIFAARCSGVVHCGISSRPSPSIAELAVEFELASELATYREIDAVSARRLVRMILSQDMAYGTMIMPSVLADELTDRFFEQFDTEGVLFYTNGNFHETQGSKFPSSGTGWYPATSTTFDTGVLVVGRQCSGCLWVEDED